jgi:MSHA pilin protein MshA
MKNIKQKGFTLIELLIVIVILGILAVAVAPKFLDFSQDAKNATADGVQGALSSAAQLGVAKLAMDSSAYNSVGVYPDATAGGIAALLELDNLTGTSGGTDDKETYTINVNGCSVVYSLTGYVAASGSGTSAVAESATGYTVTNGCD